MVPIFLPPLVVNEPPLIDESIGASGGGGGGAVPEDTPCIDAEPGSYPALDVFTVTVEYVESASPVTVTSPVPLIEDEPTEADAVQE
jgi:hypothetical protein